MSGPNREAKCGKCGYDLHGLRVEGTCPECGEYYDKFTGKGLGSMLSEKQQKADRIVARIRTIALLGFSAFVMVIGGLLALLVSDWRKPVFTAAIIATVFGLAGLSSFLHERDP